MNRVLLLLLMMFFWATGAHASVVVIVDKAKYQLHLARFGEGLNIFKSYPVTIGKASGDKMIEGDMKTPEGIYRFTQKFVPPQIKKKFGAMAFYVNYPNAMDKRENKTGFDIMLHSTDDPARLERPQDSDGCIVVNDERIKEIDSYIEPQKTMLLVYSELKDDYLSSAATDDIKEVFNNWLEAWSSKDLEAYISKYSKDFKSRGMNLDQYKAYKGALNKKYHKIEVSASNVRYFKHPKYSLVTYMQNYRSKYSDGRVAFSLEAPKRLYLVPEDGTHKIIYEGN